MFNLMKKDKERESGRKDKKDKKERMSAAELRSLEEMSMRRGFFNLKRESKRESKNKVEISNPIPIKVASSSDLTLTDIESDGISNRSAIILDEQLCAASSIDDLKGDGGGQDGHRNSVRDRVAHFGSVAKQNSSQVGQMMKRFSFSQKSKEESPSEGSTPSGQNSAAPSPQVESKVFSMLRKHSLNQQTAKPAVRQVCIPEVVHKTFPAQLQLPAVVAPVAPETRELVLQRRHTGDFGFSLRRTTMLDRSPDGGVYRRVVHFAEPGAGTKDLILGLVPGDRLVEINRCNVENKTRDEIVEMIRQSGDTVRLKVQPILELSELSHCWLRNTQELRRDARHGSVEEDSLALLPASHAAAKQSQVKTEEQIATEQAWYGSEKVWLVHKEGFSLATVLKTEPGSLPEGKVTIKLESNDTILVVDEDDIEKANPPSYDRSQDLASLLYLNESSVIHCLRQRYGGNLIHSYAGSNMVIINPLSTPSMYSEKVMLMFKGCRREDSAPHIYSVAQSAYRNLLTTRQDQSIVLLGKSGSGKTTNCQHLVQYLASIAGSTGKIFSAEKWQAVYTILEAFGNTSTSMNTNASRFSHIVSLDFDQAGQVASASIQTMLLEKMRVSRRPENESTFNIFYYMMDGADNTLRTELHFNHLAEDNTFGIIPHSKPEDKQRASQQFTKLQAAMKVLGISVDEQKALWLILGAICHLGAAGATQAGRRQFARHEWAQKAAYLLGCTLEELTSTIFKHPPKGLQHSTSFRGGPDETSQGDNSGCKVTAMECLEAMASGLYSELFTLIVSLINRALKSSQHSLCSLLIVDTPGFQNPHLAQQQRGATFEELCHNYTQERLQTLFHERTFFQELEKYKEENIELALDDIESTPSVSVAAIDQTSPQALVRTLARTDEARGLLWLMEEEAAHPAGSEESMLERLFSYYGSGQGDHKGANLLLRGRKPDMFLLGHSNGTDWVEYNTQGWLSHAKQNPAAQNAATLLQDSHKKNINGLFMGRASGATVLSGSIAGLEGRSQLALRRATSMRKTFTTGVAAVKKKSLCIQVKLQVIRKQLRDMEAKVKDQEEELDEQAGTIQMLEQAKLRLEMEMERLRQTHSKDIEGKDDEVDEIRQSYSKKLKQMEVQLEEEYEEKQKVLKEKRELESKFLSAQDKVRSGDLETEKRLRKDLKRTKTLLADAQMMLEHMKNNAPSKRETTQLKNQLEESEFTCAAAVKARKSMEVEIEDLHLQMEDISKSKQALEEQMSRVQREKNDLQTRMEEDQEDLNELMKKHKAALAQSAQNLAQISDLQGQLEEALRDKVDAQEKMQALQSQLDFQEQSMVEKSLVSRQEAKIRELETKLDFEKTQVKRLETLVARLKENLEKMTEERDQCSSSEMRDKEAGKRLQRQIRDMREEMSELGKKEGEASRKKHELEMDMESLEAANQSLQADLKLAFKRIGDLQAAIEDEMESDDNEELINSQGNSDSDSEVEGCVDEVKLWLSKSKESTKNFSDDGSLKSSSSPHGRGRYFFRSDEEEDDVSVDLSALLHTDGGSH
ncbi:unconventional myosin-XVIIIa-like [Entelurus aequoreus]|uniref:unconventional myosin-XVIIIa-like n=1 Tax=Entelurus aequoreus TaxID=161455 RepID=UPI002B1E2208|nr:unconventional myosin-XVIIIa-like [Entelurus aequoreus]